MSKQSEPAFPTRGPFLSNGMSLRDYFAGQIVQGLCVGCAGLVGNGPEFSAYAKGHCNHALAERAVVLADALLSELSKGEVKG